MNTKYFLYACLFLCTSFSLNAYAEIVIKKAYVQVVPEGYEETAVFLTIKNSDRHPVYLTKVSSPASDTAEIQHYRNNDGIMMLQKTDSVTVLGNSTLKMQPGSEQITLINLRKKLTVGKHINLSLTFSNGDRLKTKALVTDLEN
jgi:copper(I)-binding protein